MEDQKYSLKKDIARRIKILHLFFTGVVLLFLVYIIVAILLNGNVKAGFEEVCYDKTYGIIKTETIDAHRGSIYSRNGEPLATSITRREMWIDFGSERFDNYEKYCKNADTLSRKLAAYLGDRSAKEYFDELIKWRNLAIKQKDSSRTIKAKKWQFWKKDETKTKTIVTARKHISRRIFRDLDLNEWREVRNYPLFRNGLGSTYNIKDYDYRVYPQGDIALRTIGRWEERGSYGIERVMRDTLAGHKGKQRMQTIAPGYKTRVDHKDNIEAQNGYDVVTTLDINIQDVADAALREQLIAQNAWWGTTIVMECATGDILAMVNLKRNEDKCVEVQNYAIGVPVNPGSTFKLVSAMALLEKGVPTKTTYHSGLGDRIQVGGKKGATVQDSHPIGRETGGVIDMRTAFAESANVYFTKAIYDTFHSNPVEYSDFCQKLHLDKKVGMQEFGAKAKEIVPLDKRHPSRYNALVNMAYGYSIEITPLHTITLYNAIANNGRMVAPRIILRTERDGKLVNENPVKVISDKICKQSTVDTLRMFMEDVSMVGTAKEYFGENKCAFRSGSKTGTAQVDTEINKVRYYRKDNVYYGSMVTYFPAEKPRYTIMTVILTPKQPNKSYYGAGLAGPVQKRVATFLYNRDRDFAEGVGKEEFHTTTIKNGNVEKMRKVANKYGDKHTSDKRDGWGKCTEGRKGEIRISQLDIEDGRVPNVVGMGLDDALYLLEKSGMTVTIVGYGTVVQQSVAPNTLVTNSDKRITITLK